MRKVILGLSLISVLAFGGDKVIISAWGEYPIATGKILNPKKEQGQNTKYMLPNGTKGEILEWNKSYKELSSPFARVDMFKNSKVKILNGPMKGKILLISHLYITLSK